MFFQRPFLRRKMLELEKAGKLKPRDAMEALDGAYARAQLE